MNSNVNELKDKLKDELEVSDDMIWSDLSQKMISRQELTKFGLEWNEKTKWLDNVKWVDITTVVVAKEDEEEEEDEEDEDEDEYDDDDELSPLCRRRPDWSGIMKREMTSLASVAVAVASASASAIENTDDNQCAICYDCFVSTDACSTTPCGHKFHSACLFKNFEHRVECPLCRTELIKQPEEDDDDDEDDDEDDDDESESSYYSNSESGSDNEVTQLVSIKQMADKLASIGYTMEDILMFHFGGSDHPKDVSNPRWHSDVATTCASDSASTSTISVGSHILEYNKEEQKFYPESSSILERLQSDIDNILEGNLAVDYKDSRTYAQAAASLSQ